MNQYKRSAEKIIYHIQTKLQTQLSDDLRHDIFSNVLTAVVTENETAIDQAKLWKEEYLELKKKRFPLKWNEIRIKLARYKGTQIDPEQVLQWMMMLDDEQSIR